MNYYFTSDTHFCNDYMMIRENRPFKNGEEFLKYTIDLWNKQTTENDIIFHLGDFINYNNTFKNDWENGLNQVSKINAKVILIIGNNEERCIKECFNNDFELFRDYLLNKGFLDVRKDYEFEIDDIKFYLNHYPSKHKDGYYNLFGHVHRATGLYKPFGLNVGCDLNHFSLFSLSEIIRIKNEAALFWEHDIDVNS